MIKKRYIIRHCSDYKTSDKKWYEAHYSNGKNVGAMFSCESYRNFLKFTDLLNEAGYKYIENEEEY